MDFQHQNSRISFTGNNISIDEAIKAIYELSYSKAGDQQTHLNYTHDKLVYSCKWLSESAFKEIKELCWNLPGPTSLQVLLTIVILKTKLISAGLKCFFIYCTVPWILLTIVSVLAVIFVENKVDRLPETIHIVFVGCNAAAAGMMVRSFLTFFRQFLENWSKIALIIISAVVFFLYQTPSAVMFSMVLSGTISLYININDIRKKMTNNSENLFKNLSRNFLLGKNSLFLLVAIFFLMWIYFSIYPDNSYSYAFGFYIVGCLCIGPMQAIFAYFLAIFSSLGRFDTFHIWIGLPLSFLMPGTHTNIGIYFGAMIDGFRGAVIAAVCIYLPCFLSLFGLLPEWKFYRDRQGIRRLYQGIACSTTGLTLGMIALTLKHCVNYDASSTICIFVVSICLNFMLTKYNFSIVLIGGFLAYMRHISITCYRQGVYCPFPFNF